MKRKPSKRTLHNRLKRKWSHLSLYGNVVTLGNASFDAGDTLYFDQSGSVTFTAGTYITVDSSFSAFGTTKRCGKSLKKVHPARRNKEKKKTRQELAITSAGETVTLVKVDKDTWMVSGDVV